MGAEKIIQAMYVIPEHQLTELTNQLKYIIANLSTNSLSQKTEEEEYITAEMFMAKAHISRSTFDELRIKNEIKVIQKGRKLYTPKSEIHRYFNS